MSAAKDGNSFGPRWVVIIGAIGILIIILSVGLGRRWDLSDLIYDFGKTFVTVALIELFILRMLRNLASRKNELEMLSERLGDLTAEMKRSAEEWKQVKRDMQIDFMKVAVDRIEGKLNLLYDNATNQLDKIRGELNPTYAKLLELEKEKIEKSV